MNATPVIGANISQTLYKQNEKLIIPSDSVSAAFQDLASLSGINSMPQEINNMQVLMPAYLNQAHLSTWYQDNPWDVLTFSKKYGLPPMGGNVNFEQPSGHKGVSSFKFANNYPKGVGSIDSTGSMINGRENFENDSPIKIHWQ